MDRCSSSESISQALLYCRSPRVSTSPFQLHEGITTTSIPRNDAEFRRVLLLIAYSRRLVQTYSLVILSVILIFAILHGRKKLPARLLPRRREDVKAIKINKDIEDGYDSGSNTLQGTPSPPSTEDDNVKVTEDTHLLSTSPAPRPSRTSSIKAFLQYQPIRHVPLTNRPLPPNGTSLLILLLISINIFYSLFGFKLLTTSPHDLFIFADRLSLVFAANLPLLYLLAAKTQPLTYLTGYSYSSLNIFHRRLASFLCLLALLHSVGMAGVWYLLLRPQGFTLLRFVLSRIIILGILALLCYELLYLTSLSSFRARRYEVFLFLHIVLQVIALPLVFFHAPTSRPYVIIALLISTTDRLYYRLYRKRLTLPSSSVTLTVLPDGETVLLTAIVPLSSTTATKTTTRSLHQGWNPTDHVFLTIPSISRFQAHPFTIFSNAPSTRSSSDPHPPPTETNLQLLIRAQSGFSRHLLTQALTSQSPPPITLDGPYGSPHTLDMLSTKQNIVLVAGGSGIAVIWPLFHSLLEPKPAISDGPHSTTKAGKRVYVIWIVHQHEHIEWVGKSERGLREEVDRIDGAMITVLDTQHGTRRPDVCHQIEEWLYDLPQSKHGGLDGGLGVMVSGPDGLNRDVRNYGSRLVRTGVRNVEVSVEKFGW